MSQIGHTDHPVRYGSRYGSPDPTDDQAATDGRGHRSCPVCQTPVTSARARYCSDACKQRAYRLRQPDTTPLDLDALTADLRSRRALAVRTVYECPSCLRSVPSKSVTARSPRDEGLEQEVTF